MAPAKALLRRVRSGSSLKRGDEVKGRDDGPYCAWLGSWVLDRAEGNLMYRDQSSVRLELHASRPIFLIQLLTRLNFTLFYSQKLKRIAMADSTARTLRTTV
jgi:hypothetical protein